MKYNLVIVALAFAVVVSVDAAVNINICNNVADYIFLTDVTNCSKYYICVNQQPVSQICEDGLFFDAAAQSCIASSTGCLTCNATALTITGLAKTCNKYVICFGGEPVIKQCCDNLQFNVALGTCDLPTNVDCVDNNCAIYNTDILYVPSLAACDKYYICMNGQPWNQTCAAGLQFNSGCNCCDLATNVNCTIKSSKRTQMAAIKAPPKIANDINCPKEGSHFYPHARSNQYYVCVNGKGTVLSCAAGLVYDSEAESCRELRNILL